MNKKILKNRSLVKISAIVVSVLALSSLFAVPVSAWPPGAHDAIGEKVANEIDIPISIQEFRCGNILADIPHVLNLTPFCIWDANKIIHTSTFAKEMFKEAKKQANRNQENWSAGWYSHLNVDYIWGQKYLKDPDIDIEAGTLREYFFYLTNDVAIKYKLGHKLVAGCKFNEWCWYPGLVNKTYYKMSSVDYDLPIEKVNLATKVWIVAVVLYYESLPSCLECFLQNCGGLWQKTREKWKEYYNLSVNSSIENVTKLYQMDPPNCTVDFKNVDGLKEDVVTSSHKKIVISDASRPLFKKIRKRVIENLRKYRLNFAMYLLKSGVVEIPNTWDPDTGAVHANFIIRDREAWDKAVNDFSKMMKIISGITWLLTHFSVESKKSLESKEKMETSHPACCSKELTNSRGTSVHVASGKISAQKHSVFGILPFIGLFSIICFFGRKKRIRGGKNRKRNPNLGGVKKEVKNDSMPSVLSLKENRRRR